MNNKRALTGNPENEHLIQAVDLSDVGRISPVIMSNDQIVILQSDDQYNIYLTCIFRNKDVYICVFNAYFVKKITRRRYKLKFAMSIVDIMVG